MGIVLIAGAIVAVFLLVQWVKILDEWERGVILRLGRMQPKPRGPGLVLVMWPIERMIRVSLRTVTADVPPQDVITKDNVTVRVNAVTYYRVMDPNKALTQVDNYMYATAQLAQSTLRDVLGQVDLDELLSKRDKLNERLQTIVDEQTDPWGVKVTMVLIKAVDLPQEMQRAMARQAEAERERRAKIIHAQGEMQASEQLAKAAATLAEEPTAIQLRYLQTLVEIGTEQNTTVVFPIPIDLVTGWMEKAGIGTKEKK